MKFPLIGNRFRFFFGIANYLGKSLKTQCILFLPQRSLRRQATCYTSSLWASVRIQQTPAAHVKTSVTSECHFSTSRWNKYKQSWLQPGAHNPELGTFNFYSCHVDFTDQFLGKSQRNLQIWKCFFFFKITFQWSWLRYLVFLSTNALTDGTELPFSWEKVF